MSAGVLVSTYLRYLRELCWIARPALPNSAEDRSESGAALVEFTILMPVFFLILFGIIEFGSMIWLQSTMTSAAREGARAAAVQGGSMTLATQKACNRMALSSGGQTFTVSASEQGPFAVGTTTYCEVTVNVSVSKASASLMNTLFTFANGTLSASSWGGNIGAGGTMRGEDNPCGAPRTTVTCSCATAGGTPSGC